jgi:hypothetical protein
MNGSFSDELRMCTGIQWIDIYLQTNLKNDTTVLAELLKSSLRIVKRNSIYYYYN